MRTSYLFYCFLFYSFFYAGSGHAQQVLNLNDSISISCREKGFNYTTSAPFTLATLLTRAGTISSPYVSLSPDYDWIRNLQWKAELEFVVSTSMKKAKNFLLLDGINTYSIIYINDYKIWTTRDAFIRYKFYLNPYLKTGKNRIKIIFLPSDLSLLQLTQMDETILPHPEYLHRESQLYRALDNTSLPPLRGILGDIKILSWHKLHIADHYLNTKVSGKTALINESLKIDAINSPGKVIWERSFYRDYLPRPLKIMRDTFIPRQQVLNSSMLVEKFYPWLPYPGSNSFYGYKSVIRKGNDIIWEDSTSIAFREFDLSKSLNDKPATFLLNNKSIFIQGAVVLPYEYFRDRVTDEYFHYYFQLLKASHVNLVRIPASTIYAPEKFYRFCDSLGIMVMQDFMFYDAIYPLSQEYFTTLEDEITQVVKRAASHPSLCVRIGNKGAYTTMYGSDLNSPLNRSTFVKYGQTYKRIFKDKIPSVLKKYDPDVLYIETMHKNSRPIQGKFYSFRDFTASDLFKEGNLNEDYLSSIGFYGLPQAEFSRPAYGQKVDKTIENKIMDELFERFGYRDSEEGVQADEKYLSQVLQFIGLDRVITACVTSWPDCAGIIINRFNDPIPCISTALIDNGGYPKAGFYATKHNFKPISIYFKKSKNRLIPVLKTSYQEPIEYHFTIEKWNIKNENRISYDTISIMKSTDGIYNLDKYLDITIDDNSIWHIKCNYVSDSSYDYYIPDRWKKINYSPTTIEINSTPLSHGSYKINISCDNISYFTQIKSSIPGYFSDNFMLLLPGEERQVIFTPFRDADNIEFSTKSLNEIMLRN